MAFVCTKGCGKTLSSKRNLADHEAKCHGCDILQCPHCLERFDTPLKKCRHKKQCSRAHESISNTVAGNGIVGSNNNVNSNNTNITLNITVPAVDFLNTDLLQTKKDIWANPAPIQLATSQRRLHDAILAVMHFTGSPVNHNVHGLQEKGTSMTVTLNGRKAQICKRQGLETSVQNVCDVANSPEIKPLLGAVLDKELPLRPTKQSALNSLYSRYSRNIKNKGNFPWTDCSPTETPRFTSEDTLVAMFDPEAPGPMLKELCARFGFGDKWWFVGAGELNDRVLAEALRRAGIVPNPDSWQVVKDPSQILVELEILVSNVVGTYHDNLKEELVDIQRLSGVVTDMEDTAATAELSQVRTDFERRVDITRKLCTASLAKAAMRYIQTGELQSPT
jgi:hypothetical protein